VPYQANQNITRTGEATALLELRRNILSDTEIFTANIDNRIKEILKSPHLIELHIEKNILSNRTVKEQDKTEISRAYSL